MTREERRAGMGLAAIFALRMLGLFLILPVFAVHAATIPGGGDLTLVGLAIGAYGLTQACLQIAYGAASDRFGRKPVIVFGLVLFAIGSFVAAMPGDDVLRPQRGAQPVEEPHRIQPGKLHPTDIDLEFDQSGVGFAQENVELVDEIVKIFQDLFDFAVNLLLKLNRLSIHLLAIGTAIGGATTRFPLRFLLCSLQHLLQLLVFRCLLF